ncbi:Uncharacterised protein [Vibrio cholerae]|nr:Uncharacterised protein [Vibrio cholerae]CSI95803.1 Uncharacterised protein [Vibrio cholerae]
MVLIRHQSFCDHVRTEIGATNADINDISNRLAGETFPLTANHTLREGFHFSQHSVYCRHYILTVHQHR